MNWLPKTLEAVLLYHAANALARSTVRSGDVSVVPVVGAKWNRPLTMSRVLEKPFTITLSVPGAGLAIATELINGTVALTNIVDVGAGLGVTSFIATSVSCAVTVMVPATVPVTTATFVAPLKDPCVLPAGMMNVVVQVCEDPLTTQLPLENRTI